jgi:hypothetical protein
MSKRGLQRPNRGGNDRGRTVPDRCLYPVNTAEQAVNLPTIGHIPPNPTVSCFVVAHKSQVGREATPCWKGCGRSVAGGLEAVDVVEEVHRVVVGVGETKGPLLLDRVDGSQGHDVRPPPR